MTAEMNTTKLFLSGKIAAQGGIFDDDSRLDVAARLDARSMTGTNIGRDARQKYSEGFDQIFI